MVDVWHPEQLCFNSALLRFNRKGKPMIPSGRYDFLAQESILFGMPCVQAVMQTVGEMGAKRVYLVSSQSLSRKTDVVSSITTALGDCFCGLFDECVAHVPRDSVIRALAAVRSARPDLIVTVGGGTPIDTVKMLLIGLAEDLESPEQFDAFAIRLLEDGSKYVPPIKNPPIRQIAVPTTLSGAEFSNLAGCTDTNRQTKDLFTAREIGAQRVILDPAITVHTPDWLWLSTGMRAIDHAAETICSRNPQPFTDSTCLHGLSMLADSLRQTKSDPSQIEARLNSQLAVWLCCTGLNRIEWGASHGIGHQLGAVAGVPHGHTSCVMLHNVLRYNQMANEERQALISQALRRPDSSACDLIEELAKDLGMPTQLRDVGVSREHFATISTAAMQSMMVKTNPRPIFHRNQILQILEQAW